ncbi:alanine-glyoxylate transaminase [Coccomyxa subellipsoidea C-169]|uniref:alanine--glyoxylate transaminase n=1 Tax=Coccomyxa subellipsoidea (strain C-169) TaxID=574566 RepID=I0YXK5_COCSC|nr:alanine-glyoxylate transaminase [Coccomyxa subellipsoidea C-169]EIE23124.1 alanine-glyoxylate transaminase [Coccomyxa subellipsoidea C-169]|eukprot:XP_005647668.1 alanine-glyoxylate transaminase [Coccomyxa subellipsoidea C-169]
MSANFQQYAKPGEVTPEITPSRLFDTPIKVPSRLLMGPGPVNAHPRVLAAQTLPLLGHMHPPFFSIMDEIQDGLRYLFQTSSKYVLLISGTGHAGMEAAIANMLEPGETIVVGNNGIWGQRVTDLSARFGGNVVSLETAAGSTLSLEEIKASLDQHKPAVLFLCQGESSTGAQQSLAGVAEACQEHGTVLIVDTVCSLGAVPFYGDAWGVDCMYSGSQKVISAPPGAAPFMLSERGLKKLLNRKMKVASYNFDLNLIGNYWGWFSKARQYHATAMGLGALGLKPFVESDADRLVSVNTIKVPEGVDWAAVVKNAMEKYNVEIAGGLGPTAGKVWRVGIMGYNAKLENVELVIAAFRDGLQQQGYLK